jgi:hypothetical protein
VAFRPQHDDPVGGLGRFVEERAERFQHAGVDGVAFLGPRQHDRAHRAVLCDFDMIHGSGSFVSVHPGGYAPR